MKEATLDVVVVQEIIHRSSDKVLKNIFQIHSPECEYDGPRFHVGNFVLNLNI